MFLVLNSIMPSSWRNLGSTSSRSGFSANSRNRVSREKSGGSSRNCCCASALPVTRSEMIKRIAGRIPPPELTTISPAKSLQSDEPELPEQIPQVIFAECGPDVVETALAGDGHVSEVV